MIAASAFDTAYRLMTPEGGRALSVLTYHRVLPEPDSMRRAEPDAKQFRTQIERLKRFFSPIALSDAVERLASGQPLPRRAVAVTFDDGYADNLTVAAPILQAFDVPATVFVTEGFLDGGRMWNDTVVEVCRRRPPGTWDLQAIGLERIEIGSQDDRRRAASMVLRSIKHRSPEERAAAVKSLAEGVDGLPDDLMLTQQQLCALSNSGIDIGAHTLTHPILATQTQEESRREIIDSKARLEERLQKPVSLFAYPNGKEGADWNDSHVQMVREAGYRAAVTTEPGVSTGNVDPYRIPRFTPWDRSTAKYLLRMLVNARGG